MPAALDKRTPFGGVAVPVCTVHHFAAVDVDPLPNPTQTGRLRQDDDGRSARAVHAAQMLTAPAGLGVELVILTPFPCAIIFPARSSAEQRPEM